VGIDLGDRHSCYSVQNEAGEEVESGKLPTTQAGLRKHWEGEGPHRIVIEAGTSSNWVRTELEAMGHEVIVANPREVPGITRSGNKSDPEDAFKLALYGRVDARILHPIQHRSLEAQRDLAVIRARAGLVAARTQLINMSRGLAKNLGERLASCGSEQFARRVKRDLPAELAGSLGPVLKTVETLNEQIREQDAEIERLVREKYPEALRLQQVWGVGPVTALCYVLTLEDPERYLQSRSVGAFLGLRPKRSQSGQRDPQLGISKTGDRQLRWLLVECAQRVMSKKAPDSDLKRWGLQLCERGGKNAKKRAIVAVARKLAVLLHKLWKSGAVYDPLYGSKRRATAEKAAA
jgi:transposase